MRRYGRSNASNSAALSDAYYALSEVVDRLKHLVEFPYGPDKSPYNAYMRLLDPEFLTVYKAFAKHPSGKGWLDTKRGASLRIFYGVDTPPHHTENAIISFRWTGLHPAGGDIDMLVSNRVPHYRAVQQFVANAVDVQRQINDARNFTRLLVDGLNTPGQLFRVWPSLSTMLPEHAVQKIRTLKKSSQLPRGWVDEHWGTKEDREEFNRRRDGATEALAKSMMLPEEYDTSPMIWVANL
jgi:hypothetical protein